MIIIWYIHVGALLQALEDLVGVLLDLVLDIHLATFLVVLLSGKSIVKSEVVGELLLDLLPVFVVEEGIGVGHAEEQPRHALEGRGSGGLLHEQAANECSNNDKFFKTKKEDCNNG